MQKDYPYDRYQRQVILKDFGVAAQEKLAKAKVLVIGAGGLGCPVIQYLGAAGVGTIGVVDDDLVELSNLQRQPLYSMDDIGKPKVIVAVIYLRRLNPDVHVISYAQRLNSTNAIDILRGFDVIIDCTDNFSTRYLINDACVLLDKPFVYAAVSQYEGQVAIFNYRQNEPGNPIHYRDLFPEPPADNEILNCAEGGVLGVLPGIIGTLQATEAIKLITGIGEPLINKLYTYNLLNNQSYQFELHKRKDSDALVPSTTEDFQQTDYVWLCQNAEQPFEISNDQFDVLLAEGNVEVIDVREYGELPEVAEFNCRQIPLSQLGENFDKLSAPGLVFFCQSGVRSARAVQWLKEKRGMGIPVYSLKGGILNYKKQKQEEKI